MKLNTLIPIMILTICVCSFTHAQEMKPINTNNADNKWHFLIEPYLMFPNMNGTTGLGSLPDTKVNASSSDIFSNLKFGTMLYAEGTKGKWHIVSDVIYMNLNKDVEPGYVIEAGKITAKQFAWGVSGLYSLASWLDIGVGGSFNSVKLETNIDIKQIGGETTNKVKTISHSWFDPMIIVRTCNKPGTKFLYQLRGDIGGFSVGSKFAWQAQAYAGYRFTKLFQVTGGYRIIGVDYEKDDTNGTILGNNRFLYNITTSGPVIRLGFNF